MKVPVKLSETDAYKKRAEEYENKKRLITNENELGETNSFKREKITDIVEIVALVVLTVVGLLMINHLIHNSITDYIDTRIESEVSQWLS